MKVYIDLQKLAISKVVDGTSPEYTGDINSNVFEILFFNYDNTNWFPTMSQLAPNGRQAGDFEADSLGVGETHDYTEDGVNYQRFTFTMGSAWVLMKGRSNLFVWYNVLNGAVIKKCVGKLNVMLNESDDNYFISNPTFNPAVKDYMDGLASDIEDELNDKVDAQNTTIASLSQASPSVFDTAANIALLQENKGVAVATDSGYIYYWDSTLTTPAYVNSGLQYNSLANYTKHSGNQLQDANGNNIYPVIDETKINNNTDDINNLLAEGKNIFDVANITTTSGKYLNIGSGGESTNVAYLYTNEYISVKPSTTYYTNSWLKTNDAQYNLIILTCFYDIHKTFISGDSGANLSFTTPANCYYIRFSCTIDAYNARHIAISPNSQLSAYVPYYKVIKKSLVIEKIKIKVGASANSDFKNLRKCLDSITDGSINKQYVIELEEGTYDFTNDITQTELSDNTFKGIFVPDFTTIVGIGNAENTIIQLTLTSQNQYISTLNMKNTSGLENLTIKGTNTRYVIHDDFADGTEEKYYRILKNVKLIGTTCKLSTCYGCGAHSGMIASFENCIFDGTNVLTLGGLGIPFLIHNNVEWTNASYFKFKNCRFLTTKSLPDNVASSRGGLLLRTLQHAYNNVAKVANMFTYVTLEGNNINGIVLREEDSTYYGQGCMFKVTGYANTNDEYRNYATDGIDYSSYVDLI